MVNMILQRAEHFRAFEQRVPLMRVTSILLHVPAKVLAKDKEKVSALAQSIENNGPQSKTVATELLALLGQAGNESGRDDTLEPATSSSDRSALQPD